MAERRPSFPFYPKDWLASTRGLSGAARGYHADLLALSWLNGGCDPDPELLRRSVGADKAEWKRVWPELAPRWRVVNGRFVHARLEQVREEVTAYAEIKRLAGRKGGTATANGKQTPSKRAAEGAAEGLAETKPSSPISITATASEAKNASDAVAVARAPDAGAVLGALPTRKRKLAHAFESTIGLDVPQFLHDEFAAKLRNVGATEADAALVAWYAGTEGAYAGQDVGEDAIDFWRQRFREWRGSSPKRSESRRQSTGGGGCEHAPRCLSMTEHRDRILADARAEREEETA